MTAYGSDAGFQDYASARGIATVGAASEAERDSARLRASEFIDGRWGSAFPGYRVGARDQLREWPRTSAVDAEGWHIPPDQVPDEVERATYEAAIRELAQPGSLAPDITPSRRVASVSERVGPLSESITYAGGGGAEAERPIITAIDQILARLLRGQSGIITRARRS